MVEQFMSLAILSQCPARHILNQGNFVAAIKLIYSVVLLVFFPMECSKIYLQDGEGFWFLPLLY